MTAASKSTNKRACNNALFRVKERAGDTVVLCILLGGVLLFILWPMLCIALRSFRAADGGFTLEAYSNVLSKYGTSMRNSVVVGICTAICTTILSLSATLTCATRRSWGRTLCTILLTAAMVAPPFVSSLAYIQLYGRRGWITYRLLGLSWNPYNLAGVVAMQSLSFTPLNALFLLGVLDKLDADSLRSARDLGAKPSAILRDIVLPLMRPGLLVSMLLSFVRSLADYGTPVIIGGRSVTLAAEVYLQVIGYSNLEKSSAMNMFLLVPSILFFFIYRALMRRSDKLTAGSRSAQGGLSLPLTRCGSVGWLALIGSGLFFVLTLLQYGCVLLSGFLKSKKGVYSFTLDHWNELWSIGASPVVRSVVYALIVAVVGTLFAALFAYYMDHRRVPGRAFFDCIATMPYMLPGTCFGIGYILAFNHAPLKLTGMAIIVLANMLFKQLPTSAKICSATLAQLQPAQERSAQDLGAGRLAVIRDVVLPNMRPALLSCFVYNFTSSMTTAGAIIFLIDPSRQLAVFRLFDAVYRGDYALASVLASVITAIVLAVEGLVWLLSRKEGKRRVS